MGILFSSVASKPEHGTQQELGKGLGLNPMKFLSGPTALLRLPFQGFSLYLPSSRPPQPLSHPAAQVPVLDPTLASGALGLQRPVQCQHLPRQAGVFLPSTASQAPGQDPLCRGGADPVLPGAPPPLV